VNSKVATWFKEHVAAFLLTGVLLYGLYYAVTTSWETEQKLAAQSEQLGQIRGDLAEVKKSFITLLLDKNPNKSDLVKGLVSDSRTLQGIEQFKSGQFESAYAIWAPSAQQGSKDAAFAIAAANATLKQQASDTSLPAEQRERAKAALAKAPSVELHDGTFHVQPNSQH